MRGYLKYAMLTQQVKLNTHETENSKYLKCVNLQALHDATLI